MTESRPRPAKAAYPLPMVPPRSGARRPREDPWRPPDEPLAPCSGQADVLNNLRVYGGGGARQRLCCFPLLVIDWKPAETISRSKIRSYFFTSESLDFFLESRFSKFPDPFHKDFFYESSNQIRFLLLSLLIFFFVRMKICQEPDFFPKDLFNESIIQI